MSQPLGQKPLTTVYLQLLTQQVAHEDLLELLRTLPEELQQTQEALPSYAPYAQRSLDALRRIQTRLDAGDTSRTWLHESLLQALHQALPGSPLPQLPR